MSLKKITENDLAGKGNLGKPDTPGVSTGEMQRIMDELPREVIVPAFNELSEQLEAETAAAELGAAVPGTDDLPADTPKTVQGVLAALLAWAKAKLGLKADRETTYTKAETNAAIDQKVVEIGTGDMAKAVYGGSAAGVVARADVAQMAGNSSKLGGQAPEHYRSQFYNVKLLMQRQFYYKSGAASAVTTRPVAGDALPAGFTAFRVGTDIAGANGTALFVQVVKAAGGKVLAWGEASATPAATDPAAPVQTVGSDFDVPLAAGNAKVTLAAVAASEGWQAQEDGSFVQTVAATGVTESTVLSSAIVGLNDGSLTTAQKQAVAEALGYVNELVPGAGNITFVCYDSKPEVDMAVQVTEVR